MSERPTTSAVADLAHCRVVLERSGDESQAYALAERLGATVLLNGEGDGVSAPLAVRFDATGVSLVGDGMVVRGDLSTMAPRLVPHRLHAELLVKAAKIKHADGPLTAIDATAGLGEDSLLLAAAGFTVRLYESNPIIAALLRDSLRRAADVPELADAIARMELVEGDSIAALARLDFVPDVVYLDPMFPERRKSAAVKKKFQVLHAIERPCDNREELLQAALAARPRKVVIKRPPKGPHLADAAPGYSLTGKAVRFDCIVLPR